MVVPIGADERMMVQYRVSARHLGPSSQVSAGDNYQGAGFSFASRVVAGGSRKMTGWYRLSYRTSREAPRHPAHAAYPSPGCTWDHRACWRKPIDKAARHCETTVAPQDWAWEIAAT